MILPNWEEPALPHGSIEAIIIIEHRVGSIPNYKLITFAPNVCIDRCLH